MGPRLWNTLLLSLVSLVLSIALAVPLGVFSALRPGSRMDYFMNLFSFAGISIPSFWLAIVLIILFAVKFPILPAGGTQTIGNQDISFFSDLLDRSVYLILPDRKSVV
jgi:peptide/nickel transport system permease protein